MTEVVTIGDATLYHGDCLEILPTLGEVDAVVTDPPYGIDFEYNEYDDTLANWLELMPPLIRWGQENARFMVMPCCSISRLGWWYENHPPDWLISWYQCGAPARRSKIGFNTWQALCCYGRPATAMHDHFETRDQPNESRHPCPKPTGFFKWLCKRAAPHGGVIIDPMMGSGTTGIACADLGRKFIGIEIDRKYFDLACERIDAAYAQGRLFA